MLASSVVRAHQHAAGRKKRAEAPVENAAIWRSRGGLTTKMQACTDALGKAVRLLVTAGHAGDSPQFAALLAGLRRE